MSFDERLAGRVRAVLASRTDVSERRMFGGLAFMVSGNMLCSVGADHLMLRVGAVEYEATLRRAHVSEMRFTGRPMRGYVTIAPAGYSTRKAVAAWLEKSIAFVTTLPPK